MNLQYTIAQSADDLQQILALQQENLASNISAETLESQGFVTVVHDYEVLEKMNDEAAHIIVKDNDNIVAYLLAMTEDTKHDVPVLVPMFDIFGSIVYNEKRLTAYRYLVMGQVCVKAGYRGQGIFDTAYQYYQQYYQDEYEILVTEISKRNARSLRAHQRVGFHIAHEYEAPDGECWYVMLWDWQSSGTLYREE